MASGACCSAGKPVVASYAPVGKVDKVGDLDVYFTGEGERAVIVFYDIFGFSFNQVFQVCDRLAAQAGVVVACPDVFRGQPWVLEKFPPKPEDNFMGWVSKHGSWDIVKNDLQSTIEHLKAARTVKSFGTLGFCWGGCVALRAGADAQISAVGCVHAAFFGQDKAFAEQSQAPVIMLPANNDPMESLKEVFDQKPYADKCVYRRFDDQTHGFCAARGDWTKPEVAGAAAEAIDLLSAFFNKNL